MDEENHDDSCSFSTITTLTEVPSHKSLGNLSQDELDGQNENDITLSQSPIESSSNGNSHSETLFIEKLDSLVRMLPKEKLEQAKVQEVSQTLKEMYVQESSGNYHDVDKLKQLAAKYSALLLTVDQKSRSMAVLLNANNELNQYICNMEDYHTKQLGSLQAKLSLTRIEREVQSQSSSGIESSPSSPLKASENKKMKKRRSSLLFWKRSSKSTSSLNHEPIYIETTSKLQEELMQKSINIEELRKQCIDYEQKEKILEKAIHCKNIELSVKANRMQELSERIKKYHREQEMCYEVLHGVEVIAANTKLEFDQIQCDLTKQRSNVKDHSNKMKKLDWMLKRLNEENKILLTKLNTKNYKLSCEKLENQEIVTEVKKNILNLIEMTHQDRDGDKDEMDDSDTTTYSNKNILKRLMRILKENISRICELVNVNSKPEITSKESSCQTVEIVDKPLPSKTVADFGTKDSVQFDSKRQLPTIHPEMLCYSADLHHNSERDSGLSIDDDSHLSSRKFTIRHAQHEQHQRPSFLQEKYLPSSQQPRSSSFRSNYPTARNCEYKQTFDENKEFSSEFLSYVEYMKNREISGYKEDLKSLEKENYILKSSLDESNCKLKRLKHELAYQKTKTPRYYDKPLTSTPEFLKEPSKEYSLRIYGKRNETPTKDDYSTRQHSIPTYNKVLPFLSKFTKEQELDRNIVINLESETKEEDHDMFMKSFEHSNALIQGIFKEKDELQRQLELSRQQLRNKRNVEGSRMLT